MNKEISIGNVYDIIKTEFVFGRDENGKLWTLNKLAKKYDVPVTTLNYKAKQPDLDGLDWYKKRDIEIRRMNNIIEGELRKVNYERRKKIANTIKNVVDEGLKNIEMAVQGINPETGEVNPKKRRIIGVNDLIKLIKLEEALTGGDKLNESVKLIKLEAQKPIERMTEEELIEIENKLIEGVSNE